MKKIGFIIMVLCLVTSAFAFGSGSGSGSSSGSKGNNGYGSACGACTNAKERNENCYRYENQKKQATPSDEAPNKDLTN